MQRDNSFESNWAFPSIVMGTIDGATSFTVYPAPSPPSAYRSGRRRFVAAFNDEHGNLIQTRNAMRLVSKATGKEYDVCIRR